MEVKDAIFGRRSIRKYQPKDVEDEKIREILEAAIWAPSAGNTQTWRFYVVKNPEIREKLMRASYMQKQITEAPVSIVVTFDMDEMDKFYGRRGVELYGIQDTAAAIQNMLLRAYDLGLGTCWIGAFDDGEVSSILKIPATERPVAIITAGYPAENPSSTRKPLKDVVRFVE